MTRVVAAWLATLAFAVLTAGSCSIHHRSDALACTNNRDCTEPGSKCEDGVCTQPNGPGADAPRPDAKLPPDASAPACPPECTSCNVNTMRCEIDCASPSADCTKRITCPTGWDCDIACSGNQQCRAGVDCQKSRSCNVTCSGTASCRNVGCGPGPCNVQCTGQDACRTVACGPSCRCDVGCSGAARCENVSCPDFLCGTFEGGCSSQFFGCSSQCP
ncbi:MAG: hypothetical protein KIT31_03420 [Deltaproteobacteria bacterium]|nr:hypothetical protein [Deltaproteobacteria bacterium]